MSGVEVRAYFVDKFLVVLLLAVPKHGQQGGPDEAAGKLLQVIVSEPLVLRDQGDPVGGGVAFPVHPAHHAGGEALKEPHQSRLDRHTRARADTHTEGCKYSLTILSYQPQTHSHSRQ